VVRLMIGGSVLFYFSRKRLYPLRAYASTYTTSTERSLPAVKELEPELGYLPNLVRFIKRKTIAVLVHVPSWRIHGQRMQWPRTC